MGIKDLFLATEYKSRAETLEKENAGLKARVEEQETIITNQHRLLSERDYQIATQKAEREIWEQKVEEKKAVVKQLEESAAAKRIEINNLQAAIVELEDEILLQDFGLYKPMYDFSTSQEYKSRLDECRNEQKELIRSGKAATCLAQWTVDGSRAKGKKMTDDSIKQTMLIFNTECENAINRVTFSNFESMKKRIDQIFQKLNKLNQVNQITLSAQFLELKHQELALAYEYARKKQEEKEYIREQREIEKENARVQKELEEERQRIAKEQAHYQNVMQRILEQLQETGLGEDKRSALQERLESVQGEISELEAALKEVDYRQANERAGYVYVISNIGAFGEGVYKIGMTRRLDPMDRIDELGGASVPFRFDVHALVFSADAPKLETALHNAFSERRVNMMNPRKEFFRVPLDEIERVIKENHDRTVDFKYTAIAEQYRETQKILHIYSDT